MNTAIILDKSAAEAIEIFGEADRITVGAVVVTEGLSGPEFLVLRRDFKENEYGGIEELPSGAVEGSETLRDAVMREVNEETGLSIHLFLDEFFTIYYPSEKGRTVQVNFVAPVLTGHEVVLNPEEHESFRWITNEEIRGSDLTDNIKAGLALVRWTEALQLLR